MNSVAKVARLAVIGSAGRRDDASRINAALYRAAYERVDALISQMGGVKALVSGGAAFADHLAVHLFLNGRVPALRLFLPASFSLCTGRFVEPYERSPGSISNHHHRNFSRKCGGDSLKAIAKALRHPNCYTEVHFGFEERNGAIAKDADGVLAITFGREATLKAGGSSQTMEIALGRGLPTWHLCLPDMALFSPAQVAVPQPASHPQVSP